MCTSIFVRIIFSHQQTTPARTELGQFSSWMQVAGYNDLMVVLYVQHLFSLIGLLECLDLLFVRAMEKIMEHLFWIYK